MRKTSIKSVCNLSPILLAPPPHPLTHSENRWLADVLRTSTCHAWMGLRLRLTLPLLAFSGRSPCTKLRKFLSARRLRTHKWNAITRTLPDFLLTKEFAFFPWCRSPPARGTTMAAAHCGSSPRRSRLVKGKWVPRCTLSCSGLPGSCGSAPLFRTRRLLADRGAHIGGIAGVRPRRTSLGCRAHCSIAYFFQLAHPVFPVFGLGCVDGLLPERVLRPACTSVLLIFYFYPFRLLTVTGFSCQSAACRWAVSAPCVSCCGVDFPSTWASAPCPCQPTAADWIHIVTCSYR